MSFPIIHQITPHLAISDIYAARDPKCLAKHGVTHILSLLSFANITPVPEHITHLKLDILDYEDENIIDEFRITHEFIDAGVKSGGVVLIHCQAGISRSATVLCAYMMKACGLSATAALDKVKAQRSIVNPNPGFRKQLDVYEACQYDPQPGVAAYDAWRRSFYAWESKL